MGKETRRRIAREDSRRRGGSASSIRHDRRRYVPFSPAGSIDYSWRFSCSESVEPTRREFIEKNRAPGTARVGRQKSLMRKEQPRKVESPRWQPERVLHRRDLSQTRGLERANERSGHESGGLTDDKMPVLLRGRQRAGAEG